MEHIAKVEYKTLFLMILSFFALFYPMLVSIYVFLPLFIGASSYFLVEGVEKRDPGFIFFASIYLVNLEVNLSLPLFLTIISSFVFYLLLYPYLRHFRRCKFCKALLSVIVLDVMYLGALLAFDFVFQTHSVVLDTLLLYSLVVDMLVVVFL